VGVGGLAIVMLAIKIWVVGYSGTKGRDGKWGGWMGKEVCGLLFL
jgi:hypothetical protein